MDEIKAKQQVVEKIKEASKILITVSDSPSVDALSAALGLTLLLDKQEKYATAIYSGETPPAIAFLEPERSFDDTTDSLRDFIIALNKDKADHLRMPKPQPDDDMVRIYVTPYKTTITEADLEFSQGDYNVELVIALGVDNQDHLDKALDKHGQILHDAAIITITAGDQSSDLGGVDWHDAGASSLSEMIAGLAEALKDDKKKSLLNQPIATALLTGIVASTDRFSNEHTTSKAMTVAAALMAAGADQKLIADELRAAQEAPEEAIGEDEITQEEPEEPSETPEEKAPADNEIVLEKTHHHTKAHKEAAPNHKEETLADLDRRILGDEKAKEKVADEVELLQEKAAKAEAEEEAEENAEELAKVNLAAEHAAKVAQPAAPDISSSIAAAIPTLPDLQATPAVHSAYGTDDEAEEPSFGGTLNATTEQAADDARDAREDDQNKTILSHSYLGSTDDAAPATPGSAAVTEATEESESLPGAADASYAPKSLEDVHSAYAPDDNGSQQPSQGIAFGGERVIQPLAPAAPVPESPQPQQPSTPPAPTDLGLPMPPPIPDFSQLNGAVTPPVALPLPPSNSQPEILGDILAPEPQVTPAPAVAEAYAAPQQPPTQSSDPGQFQIPSQP